jgi:hypothetical protein
MSQIAKQSQTDVEIMTPGIKEENDDRAEALEQDEEDREDEDVNEAARKNEVKINYPRG